MRTAALLNPASGSAAPERVHDLLAAVCSDLEVYEPKPDDDLVALAQAVLETRKPEVFVVAGGDGSVSAVATAIGARPVRLAIVPTGTANVLARELGIPGNLEQACAVAASEQTRRIDAMQYGERRCLCRIGIGAFGEVGRHTSPQAKRLAGGLAYVWNALPHAFAGTVHRVRLEVDGRCVTVDASSVIVTNLASVGMGTLRWGEHVRLDDGKVDVFVVHGATLGDNVAVLWNALNDGVQQAEEVSHLVAREHVHVELDDDLPAVADGEYLPARVHQMHVHAGSLEVLVPDA